MLTTKNLYFSIHRPLKDATQGKEFEESDNRINKIMKDIREDRIKRENEILFNWLSGFFPDFPREQQEIIKYIRAYPEIELFYTSKIEGWREREIKEFLLRVNEVEIDRTRIIFEIKIGGK